MRYKIFCVRTISMIIFIQGRLVAKRGGKVFFKSAKPAFLQPCIICKGFRPPDNVIPAQELLIALVLLC